MGMRCPYCEGDMILIRSKKKRSKRLPPNAMTRDHILQKSMGGTMVPENIRVCCRACNELRGAIGHCIGALAAVHTVAGNRANAPYVARRWGLVTLGAQHFKPREHGDRSCG